MFYRFCLVFPSVKVDFFLVPTLNHPTLWRKPCYGSIGASPLASLPVVFCFMGLVLHLEINSTIVWGQHLLWIVWWNFHILFTIHVTHGCINRNQPRKERWRVSVICWPVNSWGPGLVIHGNPVWVCLKIGRARVLPKSLEMIIPPLYQNDNAWGPSQIFRPKHRKDLIDWFFHPIVPNILLSSIIPNCYCRCFCRFPPPKTHHLAESAGANRCSDGHLTEAVQGMSPSSKPSNIAMEAMARRSRWFNILKCWFSI